MTLSVMIFYSVMIGVLAGFIGFTYGKVERQREQINDMQGQINDMMGALDRWVGEFLTLKEEVKRIENKHAYINPCERMREHGE